MSGYISVLLQKSSLIGDWGFHLGSEPPSPNVIVTQVDTKCVASELLEPGDRVIELEGVEANKLTLEEVNLIMTNPSNRLSLVLLKRRPSGSSGNFNSPYTTRKAYCTEVSSREEQSIKTETAGDYNYYESSSRTSKTERNHDKNKKEDKKEEIKEGVYQAKPFLNETHNQRDLFEMKTRENLSNSSEDKKSFVKKDEEHVTNTFTKNFIKETSEMKKEMMGIEEKKKKSSSFWTDPPKDLRSAIKNAKFWKSPDSNLVSTSTIFNHLNDLQNQHKKINPREEKRQFWENCSKGRLGRDSPGSRSDGAGKERSDVRSKSCEPEHLKPTNPFSGYDDYRTSCPSNPFFSPSPTNPFYNVTKDGCSDVSSNGRQASTEARYSTTLKEEEKKKASGDLDQENRTEKFEEKNSMKSTGGSDFSANREFFERATSVPITSYARNAQDLVSERLSPGLKKPSDFIKKVNAESRRANSLQPDCSEQVDQREPREKSFLREMPKDNISPLSDFGFLKAGSSDSDASRRYFTKTSYEKVTRVGTPYENVESAWKTEYRVATPSGFYENNLEEIFKEERYVEQGHPEGFTAARTRTGTEVSVEEAFRELTRREGLETTNGYYHDCRRQSNQIQSNGNSNTASVNCPPPPPPPPCAGNIPSVRIASEIGARKNYEPPAAIQNAMMTKDKKPFTYTPGGLNLNEIRSPRMARRISRNAHTEDSCTPQNQQAPTSPASGQPLPPAALAAMQPQIAVPVFPPGGGAPQSPPPPPPPPPLFAPPAPVLPPHPISLSNKPLDFPPRPEFLSDITSHPPLKPVGQTPRSAFEQQPPEFLSDIANHPPLRPVGQVPRSCYEPQPSSIPVQLKPVSPKASIEQNDSASIGQDFAPRPQIEIPVINAIPASQGMTPPIQNQMGTLPIQSVKPPATPPIQQVRTPPTPQSVRAPQTPPIQSIRAPPTPPIQSVTSPAPSPQPVQNQKAPQTTSTPTLNKSPAPWLTNKQAPKEAQPPWAVRQQSTDFQPPTPPIQQSLQQPTQQTGNQTVTRVIPIQIEGREPATPPTPPTPQQQYNKTQEKNVHPQSPHYPNQQQPNYMQTQPHYVTPTSPQQQHVYPPQQYMPPQFHQYGQASPQQSYMQTQPLPQELQGRTRIIPIQIEGSNGNQQQLSQKPVYQTQSSQPGIVQNRSQNGEADPRKFQTQTSWSGNPTQSRSFRVLQKITGSDDEPQAPLQVPQGEVILVNRVYPTQERLDESEY